MTTLLRQIQLNQKALVLPQKTFFKRSTIEAFFLKIDRFEILPCSPLPEFLAGYAIAGVYLANSQFTAKIEVLIFEILC